MILGREKAEVEALFGRGTMARAITGLPGEKAYAHGFGDFDLVVAYLWGRARAWAVKRRRGPVGAFTPTERASFLAVEAPAALWKVEEGAVPKPSKGVRKKISPPADAWFALVERDPKAKDRVVREVLGFAPGGAGYAFFYLPALEGAPPVLVSEWSVQKALG